MRRLHVMCWGLLFTLLLSTGCTTAIHSDDSLIIHDPELYARQIFSGMNAAVIVPMNTYYRDLNSDGRLDLLITSPVESSRNGMPHIAFARTSSGWLLLGEFYESKDGYRVLEPSPEGNVRLLTYWHGGGGEGVIGWLISRNGKFETEKLETVFAGDNGTDEGRRRMEELFGK